MVDDTKLLGYALYLATRPELFLKVKECNKLQEPITSDMDSFSIRNWAWINNHINEFLKR